VFDSLDGLKLYGWSVLGVNLLLLRMS
jgi:hypothetical protein